MAKKLPVSASYVQLLKRVRQTLIEGQQRIEAERVRTYWETGRLIHGHVLQRKDRAEYGAGVIADLARDLKVSARHLRQCVQFAKEYASFPIRRTCAKFNWSHFRHFMSISDDNRRLRLEQDVERNEWSADELAQRIKRDRKAKDQNQPASLVGLPVEMGHWEAINAQTRRTLHLPHCHTPDGRRG